MARKKKAADDAEHGFAAEAVESLDKAAGSKALRKAAKKERKAAKKAATADEEHALTVKKARNALTVTKTILPAVLPVVAPIAVRAAGACRHAYDRYQAHRLGVAVDSLGEYSGHGAALHARIAGLSDGLSELRAGGTAEGAAFAAEAVVTVRQLSSAVRAAERMPSSRRREAHRAISAELGEIEANLLRHLGV